VIALLCPGQGAQKPGMLDAWLEQDSAGERLDRMAEAIGLDLHYLGTTADAETIKDTAVAQPLLAATSLLALSALTQRLGPVREWASVVAGHSVGEFAAAAATGVLTEPEALSLVTVRGRAMADAAAQSPSGMSAVVGGDPDEVTAALHHHRLTAANVNGGGQTVAAGDNADLQALADNPPARARVVPLPVAGAFHTQHMAPAVAYVAQAATQIEPREPETVLLSNADGQPMTDGATALASLVAQITSPVRWDLCQDYLSEHQVGAVIELAPGGVLTGLARRTLPGVPAVALKSAADLDAAVAAVTAAKENR